MQAAPKTPLAEAHTIGGRVKMAIRTAHPEITQMVVHMEPFEEQQGQLGQRAKLFAHLQQFSHNTGWQRLELVKPEFAVI